MSDIYSRVNEYIQEHAMITDGESLLAAVSGGADSMCMLDLFIRYAAEHNLRLGVVHVDHGFRAESASEAEYVESFCRERNIPFYLRRIEPGSISHAEEAARDKRYKLINEVADENGYAKVALAHNARDRAETVLFNMFRGSGISGMTGIRPVREMYIRPILCLDRDEIEDYLSEKGIAYCTDVTNLGDDYARNRIRHHVISEAEAVNAGSVRHMNDLADDAEEICLFLRELASEACEKLVTHDEDMREYRIDAAGFRELRPFVRAEILREIIMRMTPHLKDITRDHILSIDGLAGRETNGRVDLPYGIRAYREYDHISITSASASPARETEAQPEIDDLRDIGDVTSILLDNGSMMTLSLISAADAGDMSGLKSADKYTKRFDYDKIDKPVGIRSRRTGDRIVIDEDGHEKKLSRYMIESKIPERLRDSIPLLTSGSSVIWIIGYRDSCAYRIDETSRRILEVTVKNKLKGENDG